MSDRLRTWYAPGPDDVGAHAEALLDRLDGPTLLHLPGRDRSRARALVTLLHGNEPSGLRALHAWIASGREPAVDLLCLVANVDAARAMPAFSHRMLPGHRDLNRCFRPPFDDEDGAIAEELLSTLRAANVDALVDLHNNTGHNPPYAVATRVDPARLHLTWLFANRLVYTALRLGALTEVLADELPAITIECGRSGDSAADAVALAGLERYATTNRFEWDAPAPAVRLFEHPLRVSARPGIELAFASRPVAGVGLTMAPDADRHNFVQIDAGTPLGWADPNAPLPIEARGDDDRDVAAEFFQIVHGVLETRRPIVPIMMTTNARVAVQDCLFYVVRPRDGEG